MYVYVCVFDACATPPTGVQEFAEYRNVLLATPIEDDFGSDILDTHEEPLTSLFNRPTTIILETLADENKVGHTVKCVHECVRACVLIMYFICLSCLSCPWVARRGNWWCM